MRKVFYFPRTSKTTFLKLCNCFVILFLLSCNKDTSEKNKNQDCSNQSPSALIQGDWEWISTKCCGFYDSLYTPSITGYTTQVKFTSDSEYVYKNDSLQYSLVYSLKYQKDFPNPGDSTLMFYSGVDSNQSVELFQVSCDTLIINSYYVDGALTIYKRN